MQMKINGSWLWIECKVKGNKEMMRLVKGENGWFLTFTQGIFVISPFKLPSANQFGPKGPSYNKFPNVLDLNDILNSYNPSMKLSKNLGTVLKLSHK